MVRVFIDKPGGITLTDCEQAHRSLSPALDVIDPFPHAYTLEISSPGLDRPLRKIQDYRRVVGHPVNIKLREPLNGQWRLEGTLAAVEDDAVTLTIQQKKQRKPFGLPLITLPWRAGVWSFERALGQRGHHEV